MKGKLIRSCTEEDVINPTESDQSDLSNQIETGDGGSDSLRVSFPSESHQHVTVICYHY